MRGGTTLLTRYLAIFCCFIFLYAAFFRNFSIYDYESQTILSLYIPPYWQDACQFLEHPVTGSEGQFNHEKYRIRGLSITFRHGVRSPLVTFPQDYGCSPYREEDRKAFAKYQQLVESDDFQYFLRLDPKYKGFAIHPDKALCGPGELMAEGALQHANLGKYMRSRYSRSNIFKSESELNVSIITSLYNRTLQSGIAFSSGFFYPMKYKIPQLYFKATPYVSLCASPNCVCKQNWTYKVPLFDKTAPEVLIQESLRLGDMYGSVLESRPLVQILDTSLTRYICRRKPLPCLDKNCVSYSFLQDAWNYTSYERGSWNYDEKDRNHHKLNVASGYGVLFQTYEQIKKLRLFPHTNMIKVFSGHDTTVAPLLNAMHIPCLDFPRFVARVVFEIFEQKGDSNRIFLRILLNGDDVTSQARFCKGAMLDGLCPFEQLESFIVQEVPAILGGSSWSQICA